MAIHQLEELSGRVIGAAIEVHRELGPGLLESAYRRCLTEELRWRGHQVEGEVPVPVLYKGVEVECGYRLDLLVDSELLVELKCVAEFAPIHLAQVLTYLRLRNLQVGLLLNFHVPVLKDGIRRVAR